MYVLYYFGVGKMLKLLFTILGTTLFYRFDSS